MLDSLDSSLPCYRMIVFRRLAKPRAGTFHHAPDEANRSMLQTSLDFVPRSTGQAPIAGSTRRAATKHATRAAWHWASGSSNFRKNACRHCAPDTRNGAQRKHGRDHAAQDYTGHHVRHMMLVVGHTRRPNGPGYPELAHPHSCIRPQMSAHPVQSPPPCGTCMHLESSA